MIQEIEPHIYKNEYRSMLPEKDSYILIYKESSILLKNTEEGIVYPTFGEIERWNTDIYVRAIYLFSVDDRNFY